MSFVKTVIETEGQAGQENDGEKEMSNEKMNYRYVKKGFKI